MCSGLRDEMAIEGSFWRCRKGSPPGHWVPVTILTLVPTCCACSEKGANRDNTNRDNASRVADRNDPINLVTPNLIALLLNSQRCAFFGDGPPPSGQTANIIAQT